MDCNKDEAVRAKQISEMKLAERDLVGAERFALKAQRLFPELEGISPLLDVINVYLADEKKINGEVDYYKIFKVDSSADQQTLRKKFRELALALHPDKNKSVWADGAFKIFSEAWTVLSNHDKRLKYNLKLNLTTSLNLSQLAEPVNQHVVRSSCSHNSGGGSSSSTTNGTIHVPTRSSTPATSTGTFQKIPICKASQESAAPTASSSRNVSHQNMSSKATDSGFVSGDSQQGSSRHPRPIDTFWTLCTRCGTHQLHLRIFLNQDLRCFSCRKTFTAVKRRAPYGSKRRSKEQGAFASPSGSRSVPVSASRDTSAAAAAADAAPSQENLKRKREETENIEMRDVPQHQSSTGPKQGEEISDSQNTGKEGVEGTAGSSGLKKASVNVKGDSEAVSPRRSKERDFSKNEMRAMMVDMIKEEIQQKLDEWDARDSKSSCSKKVKLTTPEKDAANDTRMGEKIFRDTNDLNANESVSMSVPDADFHNFDEDRVESSFAMNQVWAAYDNYDGMPRLYAVIKGVISQNPSMIQVSWLNSKDSSEFGSLKWTQYGYPKTSGTFRVGTFVLMQNLNTFSHPVKWTKGPKGVVQIFPAKGDVWALYQNWSPHWDALTSDETIYKYDLVMVLEDYTIETGVLVRPLVKVPGFTSVFRQELNQTEMRRIPRQEMFRFSHQVPCYKLNEQEGNNVPNGCYELDPAALPLELLKVITIDDKEEKEEKVAEDPVQLSTSSDSSFPKPDVVLTYSRKMKGKDIVGGADQFQDHGEQC